MDSSRRTRISNRCAAAGVLLLALAGVLHAGAFAIAALAVGLGLIVVSHILTPCRDQLTKWWSSRISRHRP